MLHKLSLVIGLAFTFCTTSALAWDTQSEVKETRESISVMGDMAQFTLPTGSINGTGGRLDFNHTFGRRYSMEVFLTGAMGGDSSVSSTYTGFGAFGFYNPFSECCEERHNVSVNGTPILVESGERHQQFQIGLGLNEYFLNGVRAVYSASGLGVGANYIFGVYRFNVKLSARYGQLVAGSDSITATFLSAGLMFPF